MKRFIFIIVMLFGINSAFAQTLVPRGISLNFNDSLCQDLSTIVVDTPSYKLNGLSNGSLVVQTDGDQLGWYNLKIEFLDENCYIRSLDLSHPEDRKVRIKLNSSVYVPQFFVYVSDYLNIINDFAYPNMKSLSPGDSTLELSIANLSGMVWDSNLKKEVPATIDSTGITYLYLYFRKSWCDNDSTYTLEKDYCDGKSKSVAGTFKIDWIEIGNPNNNTVIAGIQNSVLSNTYTIMPNPATDNFYIDAINNSEEIRVEIYNLLGNKVSESNGYNHDVSKLDNGMYIIYIYNSDKIVTIQKLEVR